MIEQLKRLIDWLGDRVAIPPYAVIPVFSLAIGYRTSGEYTVHNVEHDPSDDVTVKRRLWGAHIAFGGSHTRSLYYNAALFFRFNFPFGFFLGIRWAGKDPSKREFFQTGIGYKLNGTFALTVRFQSDDSAGRGTNGPNSGQARGWEAGEK